MTHTIGLTPGVWPATLTERGETLTEHREAVFDPWGLYRYRLTRTWNADRLPLVVIGLNPSTADGLRDDPTIRRIRSFGIREGAGGLVMVNLFAYRATDPAELHYPDDPIGPGNDAFITAAVSEGARVIAAWGARGGMNGRDKAVLALLDALEVPVDCFGTTAAGHPRHPLYLRADTPLEPYRAARASHAGPGRA